MKTKKLLKLVIEELHHVSVTTEDYLEMRSRASKIAEIVEKEARLRWGDNWGESQAMCWIKATMR